MNFTISIRCNNAAFRDEDGHDPVTEARPEIARILHDLATMVEDGRDLKRTLFDVNGNRVGTTDLTS